MSEIRRLPGVPRYEETVDPPWEETPELEAVEEDNAPQPDLDFEAFLHEDEPDYDWVIEGLIERGDRTIVTGPEGGGKSTLLRQIAVQAAAGIHPFTLEEIRPVNVMLLDLENSRRQVRRALRPLCIAAGDADLSQARIRVVPEGIDLLSEIYRDFLDRRLEANQPELLICGPLYKLSGGDPTEEKVAKSVALFLDQMRKKYGIAILMEAHSPHPTGGGKRPERPYGASLWLRWPEFGLFLDKSGALRHWRGARDERSWPAMLQRGGEWPWSPCDDAKAVTFALILDAIRHAGRVLTQRELADLIGGSHMTIGRAIRANQRQYDEVVAEVTA